ncbi:MAG: ABC transporter ATP-binding protein [Bacteroidota bacterium]|jgi:phospholipid/cholesterol/gamma-HCH transport system ATP-binding protein|uniref:ABC transporter ATP-binding protein n=1 Tax=Candidatus Pollutiaquabacter sp. TaxID=3416354 RepID=UPI001A4BCA0D|nr:ATP-binding cassette domain-containing protein [Bacteroidota bacterium]MBL7948068.1 ATP-binding cassette domain-containing protein [Bacteroidia bacterium]MBP6009866.1 ATP-binding cassette domain-containing protein [Bacteroidia bacterium]MBP7270896.1 ATP-binding cassette domain-containing protein [Bacteroidia bacterium]MBP7436419.1 ATP-binding cassette domain-containing protein [Bacteroidia bacterium]
MAASSTNEQPIIEIRDMHKSFGKNHVLRGFNLTLHRGENVVVLGRSGCGKSVLIKCIVGLIPYDRGSLKVFGKEVSEMSIRELDEVRAKIGFVFQSSALYDSMTVRENLEFPLRRHERDHRHDSYIELVSNTLENVGLKHAIELMPSELSGGMRKRIGLARSLIMQPEIMLYDEPTTGLDAITGKEISNLMLDMQRKYNTSSIIISHDMYCARVVGNRLVALIDGINYQEGTFSELSSSKDPMVRAFFE